MIDQDKIVSDFCAAVGEPVPAIALTRIGQYRNGLAEAVRLLERVRVEAWKTGDMIVLEIDRFTHIMRMYHLVGDDDDA